MAERGDRNEDQPDKPLEVQRDRPLILVTGASGQVGGELVQTLAALGTVVAPGRSEMDLANAASVGAFIRKTRPRWIVNAAAYTAVDKAEQEAGLAYAINAEAVAAIGAAALQAGAGVLHFSTDYVFSGEGSAPYREGDATGPLGVYGASKLAGENALLESGAAALIFRTSWVYGATGKNFLKTILKLAREREELRIVNDQHGAPTWSRDLSRMAAHVIAYCGTPARAAEHRGLYHAAGAGVTTWAGFAAEAIAEVRRREPAAKLAAVIGIPTSEYPTPAQRPQNSRLCCGKLAESFGWTMMDWRDSLQNVLDEMG